MSTVIGSDDYTIIDDPETVSFTSVLSSGNLTDSSVTYCFRTPISRREVAMSGGYYTGQETVWHLPVATLTYTPKERDYITDSSGVVWRITGEIRKEVGGTIWRVVTTRER